MKHLLITFLIFFHCANIHAQRNEIINERISSLQVVADNDWLQLPVIMLNGSKVIHIDFDDLTHEYHRYAYSIEHCEADWTISEGVFSSDYVSGFAEDIQIDDIEESQNTNTLYTHYHFQVPNSQCRIKMSGNYRITVYDENNDDEIMFRAYFMVTEPRMGVSLHATSNTDIDINQHHQQIEMHVSYGDIRVTDPINQIKTVVLQNGRWDDARINQRPQYIMGDGLKWAHHQGLIFDGGNEYRKFEMLDMTHPTMGIENIGWDGNEYHAYIWQDEPRPSYIYDEDANGAFFIRNSNNIENNRISEYAQVHFTLKAPRQQGDVYLNGTWTNGQFIPPYKMEYNEISQQYEGTALLKEGYYSYQYLVLRPDGKTAPVSTEGNFYQTENQYQAFVYYRGTGERTDRLVGYQTVRYK